MPRTTYSIMRHPSIFVRIRGTEGDYHPPCAQKSSTGPVSRGHHKDNNPLTLTATSPDMKDIATLRDRGVMVSY